MTIADSTALYNKGYSRDIWSYGSNCMVSFCSTPYSGGPQTHFMSHCKTGWPDLTSFRSEISLHGSHVFDEMNFISFINQYCLVSRTYCTVSRYRTAWVTWVVAIFFSTCWTLVGSSSWTLNWVELTVLLKVLLSAARGGVTVREALLAGSYCSWGKFTTFFRVFSRDFTAHVRFVISEPSVLNSCASAYSTNEHNFDNLI